LKLIENARERPDAFVEGVRCDQTTEAVPLSEAKELEK
jgi:hypothetical protein